MSTSTTYTARSTKPERRRVGRLTLASALGYFALWAVVVLVVWFVTFLLTWMLLDATGVLTSLSKSLASILNESLPSSGVLPALRLSTLTPYALLLGVVFAFLTLISGMVFTILHNAITRITGGLVSRS